MGRVDVEPRARLRLHPAAIDPPARKNQGVGAVAIDHGEFEIAVERRAGDGLPHLNNHAAVDQSGIDLDQNASVIPPLAPPGPNLIWIKYGAARLLNQIFMTASRPRPPSIRHCPLCGVAMQTSKSRENLADFDTFRCLTCQTIISEKPRPQASGRSA
jgi:hypothetical protein